MGTKIKPYQIKGDGFNTLKEQLADLNNRVGHIYGRVNDETQLSTLSVPEGAHVFVEATNRWMRFAGGQWIPVTAASGGGGGSGSMDPELENRVRALEEQTSTVTHLFKEDFLTQNKVDTQNTTAAVGPGYVRTQKLATFTEEFLNTNNIDLANSTNITVDTANGKLKMTDASNMAIMVSKTIPTQGTQRATINAVVNHASAMAFSQVERLTNGPQATKNACFPVAVVDRTNRTWYIWSVSGAGEGLYARIVRSDGSIEYEGIILPNANLGFSNVNQRAAAAVDYNNRVWVTFYQNNLAFLVAFNSDRTIFLPPVTLHDGTNYAVRTTDIYVDRNNRIWVVWTKGYARLAVYNSDGTLYVSPTNISISSSTYSDARIVYDSTRDRIVILVSGANLHGGIYSLTGQTIQSFKQIATSVGVQQVHVAFYEPETDKIVVIAPNNLGQLRVSRYDPSNLAFVDAQDIDIANVYSSPMNAIKDGDVYRVVFVSTKESSSYTNIHYCAVKSDGTVVENDTPVTTDSAYSDYRPFIVKASDGTIRVLYETFEVSSSTGQIKMASYVLTSTTAAFYLSNDNGLTWIEAPLGQEIVFPQVGNQLRVKIEMTSPFSATNISPEILSYSIVESGVSGALTQEFVSTTLPSVTPIAHATLNVNQQLNDGTITWYLSNNGGQTWVLATPGVRVTFPDPFNADLRVKAVLTLPDGGTYSPIIYGYSVLSGNIVLVSDFRDLQINLMKTNFKVAALLAASRYNLKNMIVDDFQDTSGIDAAKSSGYIFDSVNKAVKKDEGSAEAIVTAVAESLSFVPKTLLLVVDHTLNSGQITYEVSRDGGMTWTQVAPEQTISLSAQPNGTSLMVRARITGDAVLNAWAYSWG